MTTESNLQITLPAEAAGERLDRALAISLRELSRERLKALILAGQVSGPKGAMTDPAERVKGGESLQIVVPPPEPAEAKAQPIPLQIVYEDADLIVIDKPPGLVVHPAAGNPAGTLVNALLHHCAGQLSGIGGVARPGIVHRIDKDTSGLLVAAKNDSAHEALARQFAAHSIGRRYAAIVSGIPVPLSGRIEGAIGRSPKNRKKMAVVERGGKRAVTFYETRQRLRDAALVECRLETGRTHQVRVHMASIGHPLLGDPLYGRAKMSQRGLAKLDFRRQALHAKWLQFIHPRTQHILTFESPLPQDMRELMVALSV